MVRMTPLNHLQYIFLNIIKHYIPILSKAYHSRKNIKIAFRYLASIWWCIYVFEDEVNNPTRIIQGLLMICKLDTTRCAFLFICIIRAFKGGGNKLPWRNQCQYQYSAFSELSIWNMCGPFCEWLPNFN